MASRRKFLAGLLAASACPVPSWADAGDPSFVAAAKRVDGSYALLGLSAFGEPVFEIPLPGRGHAAAAHPLQPYVVAFARRPGNFALVINCGIGQVERRLDAPEGRHFYGHGAFSADGALMFTTENDYEEAEGRIGVWDVRRGYKRVGEFSSGGIGPHDLRLMPNGASLVVANGGIETHPDSGRTKLNLPTMQPNLSYISLDGAVLEQVALAPELRLASIRHLAVRADGLVAVGCQWQGNAQGAALVYTHRRGESVVSLPEPSLPVDLKGYIGSIAISGNGQIVAATSPRGNAVVLYDLANDTVQAYGHADICGAAPTHGGVALTTGQGQFLRTELGPPNLSANAPIAWDNHLVALTTMGS